MVLFEQTMRSCLLGVVRTSPFILIWRTYGLFYMAAQLLPSVYELANLSSYLDFTTEGIRRRGFGGDRKIAWDEIIAIFCHREGKVRSFVVVSRQHAIAIPPPIARDLDTMRKFFYSIPNDTPCVNFDENFRKGYRRRKRKAKQIGAPVPDLIGGSF